MFDTLDQRGKETNPARYECIAKRHKRYAEKVESYTRPKYIETEYDLSKRRIISKTVNGQQRFCPK